MKKSTMLALCEADPMIEVAANFGFDFPPVRDALEAEWDSLANEGIEYTKGSVMNIVERLDLEDLGKLVFWLLEPNNIDSDSLIPNITKYYASGAEMWLDENRSRLADPIKKEVQDLYKTLLETEIDTLRGALRNAVRSKLELLEQLGAPVELISGVYEYTE